MFNKNYCHIYQLFVIKIRSQIKKQKEFNIKKKFINKKHLFIIVKNDLCNNLDISTKCIFTGKFVFINKKINFNIKNSMNSLYLNLLFLNRKTYKNDIPEQFMLITVLEACFVVIEDFNLNDNPDSIQSNLMYFYKKQITIIKDQKILFIRLKIKIDKFFFYKFILHIFIPFMRGNFFFKKVFFLWLTYNQNYSEEHV